MRVRVCPVLSLLIALFPFTASAQSQPASTVRTLLAAGRVGSVVDTSLNFRLLSVRLPAAQRVSYSGPNAMVYTAAGGLGFELDGNSQPLAEGAGAFIPAGRAATFSASGPEPANFLLFVLSPVADFEKPLLGAPAAVEELYRSPEPLPGLQAGPYEFSLIRVALPSGMPANPPHYGPAPPCTTSPKAAGHSPPTEKASRGLPEWRISSGRVGSTNGQIRVPARSF